jgi:hypothetical protein
MVVVAAAAAAVRRAPGVPAAKAEDRTPHTPVILGKTGGSALWVPAGNAVPMLSAAVVEAAADTTAAVAAEAVRTDPLTTAAVAEEWAVLHSPSPRPRKFVSGRIGKTPRATVS